MGETGDEVVRKNGGGDWGEYVLLRGGGSVAGVV